MSMAGDTVEHVNDCARLDVRIMFCEGTGRQFEEGMLEARSDVPYTARPIDYDAVSFTW